MPLLDKLESIPASIAAVCDYEKAAEPRVSAEAWAYLSGGAGDERTLAENLAAFRRIPLQQRVLQDLSTGDTQTTLFGHTYQTPIFIAPVAFQKLVHPDGEIATAAAAAALDIGMAVSTQASASLEEIASHMHIPPWFQLYFQADRGFTKDLVARAEAAGYGLLLVTVDAPVNGLRNREQRAGFYLPAGVEAVNLKGAKSQTVQGRLLGSDLLAAAPTWRDIEWLRSITRLPIVLKGVTAIEDAQTAKEAGVEGIVVSNHGGRTLDDQRATIDLLPEIVEAVDDAMPVLLDSGIRRGADIYKALARGASGVLIGRAFMYGLATAGALGVAHVLQILRAELEVTMALTGNVALSQIRSRNRR